MVSTSPKRPFYRRKRWLIGAVAVVLVAAAAVAVASRSSSAAKSAPAEDKPPTLPIEFAANEVTRLEAQSLGQEVRVTGSLEAVEKVTLRSKTAAEVRSLPVREGDRVSAGQLVAQIDTADVEARLAERIGALETARANLALAKKNQLTNRDLLAQGYISQNAFDAIEASHQANVGQVQAAEANVALARNALRDAKVTSPISGIVSKRHVQPGEKVGVDAALLSIVDLRKLELQAMVPADDVPRIRVGATASIRVDGYPERQFVGKVERIAPATESGTRAILVLISVPNQDEALKAGMFASGAVAVERTPPVPTLPLDAVQTASGESAVWVIDQDKLSRRIVRTGRKDEQSKRVEILSGVNAGDTVLAARFDKLTEGAAARVGSPGKQAS